MDTPFKRVVVDIVGPIAPPSEAGHRYILTLIDYATRYPEAVPRKKITTEAVVEALLHIYSRVGIPEEVLTQCMQEISRQLSIKGLTITPYHPICNGLFERWNGTLKSMLKRLCQDQLKQMAQSDQACSVCIKRSSSRVDRIQSIPVIVWTVG